jgi:hypothetical protein
LDWVSVGISRHGGKEKDVMSARYGKYIQSECPYLAEAEKISKISYSGKWQIQPFQLELPFSDESGAESTGTPRQSMAESRTK